MAESAELGCDQRSCRQAQADLALDMVYERLNTEYGAILMDPPYHAHAFDGALAVIYNAGTKENAGIFSQSQGWIILAEAFEDMEREHLAILWRMLRQHRMTGQRSADWSHTAMDSLQKEKQARIFGRSHVHWLTGTASTVMVGCVEESLACVLTFMDFALHRRFRKNGKSLR